MYICDMYVFVYTCMHTYAHVCMSMHVCVMCICAYVNIAEIGQGGGCPSTLVMRFNDQLPSRALKAMIWGEKLVY